MSRIGIFGGSFNPIHNGHIYIAEKVKEKLFLDSIIFIPTGVAPHKDNCDFADKYHRYNMVKIAVDGKFDISDIEIKTDKICYTVDTMAKVKEIYKNDEIFYIIGADSLKNFMKWKEPLKLFEMLNIVVVDREGVDIDKIADEYREQYDAKINVCHLTEYNISSTDVRNAIKSKNDFNELLPQKVREYIIDNKLYTEDI